MQCHVKPYKMSKINKIKKTFVTLILPYKMSQLKKIRKKLNDLYEVNIVWNKTIVKLLGYWALRYVTNLTLPLYGLP